MKHEITEAMKSATLGALIDHLYNVQQTRIANQKIVDAEKEFEGRLKELVLAKLAEQNVEGSKGTLATVSKTLKVVPTVDDWPELYKHIQLTGRFDLLQKRAAVQAMRDVWESDGDDAIPGVERQAKTELTIRKR